MNKKVLLKVCVFVIVIIGTLIIIFNNRINKDRLLSSSEIEEILGESKPFCIENIEKEGDEYIITAYTLKKESRIITKSEFEKLLSGGEIEFRNLKWKKEDITLIEMQDGKVSGIAIRSGEKQLKVCYNSEKKEGTLENMAGAKTSGLQDYSKKLVKFKVSKDILIGGMIFTKFEYDENGEIKAYSYDEDEKEITNYKSMTFDELLDLSKKRTGSYQECTAIIKDGKVDAIQILED